MSSHAVIHLGTDAEHRHRVKRLHAVIDKSKELAAEALVDRVVAVHDREGELIVVWKVTPSADDRNILEAAWELEGGSGKPVRHEVDPSQL